MKGAIYYVKNGRTYVRGIANIEGEAELWSYAMFFVHGHNHSTINTGNAYWEWALVRRYGAYIFKLTLDGNTIHEKYQEEMGDMV
jgi:hypothetical protein